MFGQRNSPAADTPPPQAGEPSRPPEEFFEPTGEPEALTGRAPAPVVKRFNRRTVAVIVGVLALAAILAFGTALTRRQKQLQNQDSAAQKTAANATANEAINGLPNDYGQIKRDAPKLGPPLPGEAGAFNKGAVAAAGPGQPRALTPWEQYEEQREMERRKRADKAREAQFAFAGGDGQGQGLGGAGTAGATQAGYTNSMAQLNETMRSQQDLVRAVRTAAAGGGAAGAGAPGAGGDGPPSPGTAARDDANRQDDKTKFMEKERDSRFYLKELQRQPRSPYALMGGTIIPGVLITGMNSDLPGQIKGQVSQNVYDTVTGRHLLVPQGTMLIGTYDSRITYGQSRILIVWTRLIRPDGSNIDLEGMPGTDLSGYAGVTGDVDRHILRLVSAVVLGSFVQAGVQAGGTVGGYGATQGFGEAFQQGAGQGINTATQQIIRRELYVQPTIKVAPGERFNIFTTKDIVLTPYGSQ